MTALLARAHARSGLVHATLGHFWPRALCGVDCWGGTSPDEDREYEIECLTCARIYYANEKHYQLRDYRPLSDAEKAEAYANMRRTPGAGPSPRMRARMQDDADMLRDAEGR